jgi:hypothetical protein
LFVEFLRLINGEMWHENFLYKKENIDEQNKQNGDLSSPSCSSM